VTIEIPDTSEHRALFWSHIAELATVDSWDPSAPASDVNNAVADYEEARDSATFT